MLVIHSVDKDLEYRNEYDLLVDVYYKGEPFTGILEDEHERLAYRNGSAHGEGVCFYGSGKLYTTSYYENGVDLKNTTFFESGELNKESIFDPVSGNHSYKVWNKAGNLIRDKERWYYANGQIKETREAQNTSDVIWKRYSTSGEWMWVVSDKKGYAGKIEREMIYNEPVMWANYHQSLIEENPELAGSDEKNQTHAIWMWFWKVFDVDGKKYLEIVANLLKHPETEVRRTIANIIAIHKLNGYLGNEILEDPESAALIEELTAYHDAREPDREAKKLMI